MGVDGWNENLFSKLDDTYIYRIFYHKQSGVHRILK